MRKEAIEDIFPATKLIQMFQMKITKTTLLNMEEKGLIPKAHRASRGQVQARYWDLEQLPLIGEACGFIAKPQYPHVISIFSLKGGTNKSTFSFQVARILALHNIKTLIVGMDAQESITQTLRGPYYNFENEDNVMGLYHVLTGEKRLEDVIEKTDLHTLDFIPETIELSVLNRWLNTQSYADKLIRKKIIKPLLGKYQMVIFDCNPSWDLVVTNALDASDILLSPLGCDINSLKATRIFTDLLSDFQEAKEEKFGVYKLIPTMAEANKLSQQILAKYKLEYFDVSTAGSIRRSITAQEANVLGKSLIETAPNSSVTEDYIEIIKEIMALIQKAEKDYALDPTANLSFDQQKQAHLNFIS